MAGLLAATIGRLCEGEVRELQDAYQVARTEEAYLASIEGKTASLLSSACRIGAIVADLPRPEIDALTEFGLAYGMAFQIVDDILDVVATDEQLGKPAGHDHGGRQCHQEPRPEMAIPGFAVRVGNTPGHSGLRKRDSLLMRSWGASVA